MALVDAGSSVALGEGRAFASGSYRYGWVAKQNLPVARYAGFITEINGELHYLFGEDRVSPYKRATWLKYNRDLNAWTQGTIAAPVPSIGQSIARSEAAFGYIDGWVYVIGGTDDIGADNFEVTAFRWNPETGQVQARANAPAGIGGSVVYGTYNGRIYYLQGGQNLYSYHPATNTYATHASTGVALTFGTGCFAADNKLHYFGGGTGANLRVHRVYDPATNAWTTSTPPPVDIYASGPCAAKNNQIYIFGTQSSPTTVYIFDLTTNLWSNGPTNPVSRTFPGSGAAYPSRDGFWVIGGGASTNATADVSVQLLRLPEQDGGVASARGYGFASAHAEGSGLALGEGTASGDGETFPSPVPLTMYAGPLPVSGQAIHNFYMGEFADGEEAENILPTRLPFVLNTEEN